MQVNSAEPSTSSSDGPSVRIPVDVRRFPVDPAARRRLRVRLPRGRAVLFRRSRRSRRLGRRDRAARRRTIAGATRSPRSSPASRNGVSAPPRAREAGRLLADPRTVAVVTGQQAGLFGGPLFTLLKALTALKLAEQVSRDHSVPAVAVFWIDAEDHDWDEVRSCTVLRRDADAAHGLAAGAAAGASRRRSRPSGSTTPSLDVLDELERILPPTEFRPSLMTTLAPRVRAGRRHGRRVRPLDRAACSATAGWSSTTRRTRRRSRSSARCSRASCRCRARP